MDEPTIIERMYQKALDAMMQQTNISFRLSAELDIANERIRVLEKEQKDSLNV